MALSLDSKRHFGQNCHAIAIAHQLHNGGQTRRTEFCKGFNASALAQAQGLIAQTVTFFE